MPLLPDLAGSAGRRGVSDFISEWPISFTVVGRVWIGWSLRSQVHVLYVPASRDPARQLARASGHCFRGCSNPSNGRRKFSERSTRRQTGGQGHSKVCGTKSPLLLCRVAEPRRHLVFCWRFPTGTHAAGNGGARSSQHDVASPASVAWAESQVVSTGCYLVIGCRWHTAQLEAGRPESQCGRRGLRKRFHRETRFGTPGFRSSSYWSGRIVNVA
jgi:hypothetical protein